MAMAIEKAIDRLEDLHFEQDNWEYGELTEDCLLNREALRLAIETMRKYKKIQEVMVHWVGTQCVEVDLQTLFKIREVIEDGNDT